MFQFRLGVVLGNRYNTVMLEWMSLPLSIFAYTLLSIGLVLQKKGIAWIGFKGKKDGNFYRPLAIWFAGFLLMNLYIVPNTAALKHLPPHIVSAMAGWGVVVLVLLSVWLLLFPPFSLIVLRNVLGVSPFPLSSSLCFLPLWAFPSAALVTEPTRFCCA